MSDTGGGVRYYVFKKRKNGAKASAIVPSIALSFERRANHFPIGGSFLSPLVTLSSYNNSCV
jgi:hypothetical protein